MRLRYVTIVAAVMGMACAPSCRWGFELSEAALNSSGGAGSTPGGAGGDADPGAGGGGDPVSGGTAGATSSGGSDPGAGGTGMGGAATGGATTGGTGGTLPVATGPFGTATVITNLESTFPTDDPSFTSDLTELYMGSFRSMTGYEEIYRSTRSSPSEQWSVPEPVDELNDGQFNGQPGVTADGLTLYFIRGSTSEEKMRDIYVSTRANRSDDWGTPVLFAPSIASAEFSPFGTSDRLLVACGNDRATGFMEQLIWVERDSTDDAWGAFVEIPDVGSPAGEGEVWMSEDRQHMFFRSDRIAGAAGELFYAKRAEDGGFETPVHHDEFGSSFKEGDPWLSQDLSYIMFVSDRDGTEKIYEAFR